MSATPPLARSIGVTERALRSLLDQRLLEAGLSFAQWAVLNFLHAGGPLSPAQLIGQQQAAFVADEAQAREAVDDLLARGLIGPGIEADGTGAPAEGPLTVTEAGRAVFEPLRAGSVTVTQELWGDLPAADLEATHRTLTEIGRRANLRLAGHS
jgi:hypothetical protein